MNIRVIYFLLLTGAVACSQQGKESTTNEDQTLYKEKHRLQVHFSPSEKWMNDPNGLVYFNDEYHLFYQYYPDSTVWGPMHWGHAVSKDMIHWQHLPIALFPDKLGYIFSGSAVFDKNNSSGLGTKENPPLVAIFTYHDAEMEKQGSDIYQTQGLAYSLDSGRTWVKYEGNPVLPNPGIKDFRDPKVFWMDDKNKWIMSLAVKDHISFYSSSNLRDWTLESDFGADLGAHGGVWECPDLFLLDNKWVLLVSINPGGPNGGSATQYFVGDFDGKKFVPQDDKIRWLDYGRDNYAGVTWSNVPEADGRRLFIGWMSNWHYANVVPTERWRSAMTVPRTLSLATLAGGNIVTSTPVAEFEQLRQNGVEINKSVDTTIDLNPDKQSIYDLQLNITNDETITPFQIILSNAEGEQLQINYDPSQNQFVIDRDRSGKNSFSEQFTGLQYGPFPFKGKAMKLRLIVDVSSIELFVNEGQLAMTSIFFPTSPMTTAQLKQQAEENEVSGTIYSLKGIWD